MTEQEWLACDNPDRMLLFACWMIGSRKSRLLSAACCRRVWHLLKDDVSRKAVEVAERFAEGQAGETERFGARDDSIDALEAEDTPSGWAAGACSHALDPDHFTGLIWTARSAAAAFADDFWRHAVTTSAPGVGGRGWQIPSPGAHTKAWQERREQAALVRDLFGPLPFRRVAVDPFWLAANDRVVVRLARSAYENRSQPSGRLDATRLAVLGDALEDAGCGDAEILDHLRSPGPHVRGCWALDLLLGKE